METAALEVGLFQCDRKPPDGFKRGNNMTIFLFKRTHLFASWTMD